MLSQNYSIYLLNNQSLLASEVLGHTYYTSFNELDELPFKTFLFQIMWDAKILEGIEGVNRVESFESEKPSEVYDYKEYKEPEIEQDLQDVGEEDEEGHEAEENVAEVLDLLFQ